MSQELERRATNKLATAEEHTYFREKSGSSDKPHIGNINSK